MYGEAVSSPWRSPPEQLIFFKGLTKEALGELKVRHTLKGSYDCAPIAFELVFISCYSSSSPTPDHL